MNKLKVDFSKTKGFINQDEYGKISYQAKAAIELLHNKTGPGNDFLGWLDLPKNYDKEEFLRIKAAAEKIKAQSDALITIGIGGSYLGARAAIEFLNGPLYNVKTKEFPQIFFAGNTISSEYHKDLLSLMEEKDFSINVISKSGTTTEPALAFRLFKDLMEKKYGKEGAKERIFVTTDANKGTLLNLAREEGYETFVVPDIIGGRFSVLTAVGLLPIACAGADIDALMQGAYDAMVDYCDTDIEKNDCLKYAVSRNLLYRKGKNVETLVSYEPAMVMFSEWYKQLFGESEGKEQKGILPTSMNFSTDLHSLGQYVQEGLRNLFETVITVENPTANITISEDKDNVDGLNFLAGKTVDYVNKKAFLGTLMAHYDGGVPNIVISLDKKDEYNLGYLFYFFEKACAISGYMLGVNPFDQPGVEVYKKNMFALLGKDGYQDMKADLEARIDALSK
ncbi:MAG: glucose-6-phosphate isomerase [Clostridia bacterium]|nr:glucose-6-phosphate isomerase [Clostridia bacterium]